MLNHHKNGSRFVPAGSQKEITKKYQKPANQQIGRLFLFRIGQNVQFFGSRIKSAGWHRLPGSIVS